MVDAYKNMMPIVPAEGQLLRVQGHTQLQGIPMPVIADDDETDEYDRLIDNPWREQQASVYGLPGNEGFGSDE